ncbi:endonuclease [Xanthomonas phage X1]|nr:endonuclease [Xanthomonas phage X1]
MARAKKVIECDPWYFRGQPFPEEGADGYEGFVYLITMPNGKKYIGKKFFNGMRKQKGKKRRSKVSSNWMTYFSSSEFINNYVKENGTKGIRRDILSLHTLKRDVNFCEVLYQFQYNVLEEKDANGERVWLNDQISGKYWPHLVMGWRDRSDVCLPL